MRKHLSIVLGAWLAATVTAAAEDAPASAAVPAAIEACAALPRDAERLVCYDQAVAALRAGRDASAVTAENMFGANSGNTRSAAASAAAAREELRQIRGTVTSLRHADDGMIVLELDNGQVWRQQDSGVHLVVAQGDEVTVTRGSLGTFRITDKSGRFSRFKRVR